MILKKSDNNFDHIYDITRFSNGGRISLFTLPNHWFIVKMFVKILDLP